MGIISELILMNIMGAAVTHELNKKLPPWDVRVHTDDGLDIDFYTGDETLMNEFREKDNWKYSQRAQKRKHRS